MQCKADVKPGIGEAMSQIRHNPNNSQFLKLKAKWLKLFLLMLLLPVNQTENPLEDSPDKTENYVL